jgi:hypothetical protein
MTSHKSGATLLPLIALIVPIALPQRNLLAQGESPTSTPATSTATPIVTPLPPGPTLTPPPGGVTLDVTVYEQGWTPLTGWQVVAYNTQTGQIAGQGGTGANGLARIALAPGGYRICLNAQRQPEPNTNANAHLKPNCICDGARRSLADTHANAQPRIRQRQRQRL